MTLLYLPRCLRVALYSSLAALALTIAACSKPPTIDSLMADARQYQQSGNTKSAVIQLNNVLQQNPKHAEARYLLGSIYLHSGDALRAETQLREALLAKFDAKLALPLFAQALFEQGKFQKILDETRFSDYGEAAAQPGIMSLRGHALISLGKTEEAAQAFAEALKLKPDFAQAVLGQVRLAIQKNDTAAALQLANKAVASDPKSLDGWLMKGDLERSMSRLDAAKAAYQKALDLEPGDVSANLNMASIIMDGGKFEDARRYAEAIRRAAPDSAVGHYLLGLIEFRKGNLKAADESIQQALKIAPNYLPATALSGAVAYALGSYEKAEQQLQDAITQYPNSIYLRRRLAATLLKENKSQQALDLLEPMVESAGDDTNLLALIAEAYYQKGDIAKSKRYYESAAKKNPASPKVRTGLALARLVTGETERAIADLESAVEGGNGDAEVVLISSLLSTKQFDIAYGVITRLEKARANDPNTLNMKGTILLARKKLPEARKAFERVLEIQPGYFPASMNLAALDIAEKRFQAAQTRYEKILETAPSNIEVMMALAKLEAASGKQRDAISWLERAKSMQPKAFAPNFTLAQVFIEQRDYSKAIAILQDALAEKPQHPEALNMLGYSQLQAGQTGNAVSTYTKLVSLYPRSAQAVYGLGVAQSATNNQAGAIVTLQRAIDLQPDFPEAIATLVSLQIKAGQVADAMKTAGQAQQRFPKRAFGFLIEGDVEMADKKYSQAVHAYEKALQIERSSAVIARLHQALRMANQGVAANSLLVNWLRDHPEDIQIRLNYADAAIKESNYPLAVAQYRYVLQKQPQNLAVSHNLIWCYQQQHDEAKALAVAEEAHKLNPEAPAAMMDLADLLLSQGEGGRAVKLLEKARDLAPAVPQPRYFLAKAYLKSGDRERARKELEQLLISKEDFIERADAAELLRQLNR